MPVQTSKKSNVYLPDGALISVKADGEAIYTDVGAINSAVTATLNWDENQVETANAGKLDKQIRNMTIGGAFTLIDLNAETVTRLGGGVFTKVDTAGTEILAAAFANQTIVTFVANEPIDLAPTVVATGAAIRFSAAPVITSITASTSGVLAVNDDYVLVKDPNAFSGYSIQFIPAGTATVAPSETMVIVYGNNTPIAKSTIYAGSSTAVLAAYAMKITHTDDNGLKRELELFSVDSSSGGFQFNFKGANEDGVEEMPLAFTAKLNTVLTNGRQLMAWSVETGAM